MAKFHGNKIKKLTIKIKTHFGYQKLVPFPKFYKMYLKIIVIIFYFDFVKL